jgi:glycosyltransferase involved in cell wall biosynthesis
MKIYYLANARMPSEKAYGIQTAKMCEAFIEAGVELTLVVPDRNGPKNSLREFYRLRVDVPVVRLPVPDYYTRGRFGYAFSSVVFMLLSALFVLRKRLRERLAVYTLDMDAFSNCLFPLLAPTFSEVHSDKRPTFLQKILVHRAHGIIATNGPIEESLKATFKIPNDRLLVEPNGVDESQFKHTLSREEARREVGLDEHGQVALYVGRFYAWKRLGILNEVAQTLKPDAVRVVVAGGSRERFEQEFKTPGDALTFVEDIPYAEVPRWLAAADVLLILGSKEGDESFRYTSPMKVYEYAAAKRSIVASDTPALRYPLDDTRAFFYAPDNAQSLAKVVREALTSPSANSKIEYAYRDAQEHTWRRRAERIVDFMNKHMNL